MSTTEKAFAGLITAIFLMIIGSFLLTLSWRMAEKRLYILKHEAVTRGHATWVVDGNTITWKWNDQKSSD